MARTAGSNRDQDISDEELRRITGVGPGEEDQMEAAAQDPSRSDELKAQAKDYAAHQASRAATHGALYAAEKGAMGQKIRPLAGMARQELKNAEAAGFDTRNLYNPAWYKDTGVETGKKYAKKGVRAFVKKQKAAVIVTLILNAIIVIALLLLFFIAPFKHIHFETVLRSANFARFLLVVRKQFTAVIFNASTLTQHSVGNFRNSPLVRQIRLAIPDRQLAQLGRQGVIQWEFRANSSFGNEFLPLRETLRAVVIRGQRFDLDQFARDAFGRDYAQLSTRERYTVQNNFIRAVNVPLGDMMALMPRHVRWNPMVRLHQRAGIRLVKWLNAARDYLGKNQQQARSQIATETSQRVMDPAQRRATSAIPEINDDADRARQDYVDNRSQGRPPGVIRSRMAGIARGARAVSDVVFATTVYCIARELYNAFSSPEAQFDREAQAARMGANDMTTTDQIKAHDVTAPAVGAANGQWDAQGDMPDASQSVIYKKMTDQPIPNKDTYKTQQIPFLDPSQIFGEWQDEFEALGKSIDSPIAGVLALLGIDFNLGQKEVNDKVCQALLNEYVQYGIAGAEIAIAIFTLSASKGVTAAVKGALELVFHFAIGLGLGQLLNLLIEWVVKEYARLYFTGLEQGAERVNTGYVAQNSIAQHSNRNVTYGRPMDLNESNAAQQVAMQEIRKEHNDQGFMHRYFAIDNPFSLLGLTVAKLPVSTGGFAATLQNGLHFVGSLLTSPTRLVSSIGNAFVPPVFADTPISSRTNFGVTQWGWSLQEQQRIQSDESFSMDAQPGQDPPLLAYVEPRKAEFDERYAKCYDSETFALQSEEPKDGVRKICTKEFLSTDDALHWRYYMALLFAAKELTGSAFKSE